MLIFFRVAGRIPFAYLEDIHMRFMKNYGKVASTALAYAMNDEFSRVLHQQMEYFSSNPNADTINRVKGEIAEVALLTKPLHSHTWSVMLLYSFMCRIRSLSVPISFGQVLCLFLFFTDKNLLIQVRAVMVENIDKVLERGDRIELLVDKTSTIQDNTFRFKKQSRRLRQAMWMKNAKLL
jgi:vesicle-associated membrane protein 7